MNKYTLKVVSYWSKNWSTLFAAFGNFATLLLESIKLCFEDVVGFIPTQVCDVAWGIFLVSLMSILRLFKVVDKLLFLFTELSNITLWVTKVCNRSIVTILNRCDLQDWLLTLGFTFFCQKFFIRLLPPCTCWEFWVDLLVRSFEFCGLVPFVIWMGLASQSEFAFEVVFLGG